MSAINTLISMTGKKAPNAPKPGALSVDGGTNVNTTNFDPDSGGGFKSGQDFGGNLWDTSLDSQVGAQDTIIKAQEAVRGTSSFNDATYNKAVEDRTGLNIQRWQSANISGSAAKDHLRQMLQSGQLSFADLGKIDITQLTDDGALAQTIDNIVAAKTAATAPPAPSAVPQGPDPVAEAAKRAQDAVSAGVASIDAAGANIMANAMGTFDKNVGEAGAGIESNSGKLANSLGGAAAGQAAGEAGAALQANATAQRETVVAKAKTDIQKFIDSHLSADVNQQMDVTTMDAQKKVQLQTQGLTALRDELTKNVDMSDANAANMVTAMNTSIDEFNAAVKRGEEGTAEMNKILGIAGGLIMAGAAGAGILLSDGAATPFLAPVVAGGVMGAVGAARS